MKASKNIIGIDNGVTGTVAILYENGISLFYQTPVINVRDYTQEVQHFNRIDWETLLHNIPANSIAVIERPLVNSKAFVATKSALRALEATLIVLEIREIPYEFIDSKSWQKEFISSAVMGKEQMKEASKSIGIDLFPQHRTKIEEHGDADSLLLALYYKQKLGW